MPYRIVFGLFQNSAWSVSVSFAISAASYRSCSASTSAFTSGRLISIAWRSVA